MTGSRVVKCGVNISNGLVGTQLHQGRIVCTNCGTEISDHTQTDTRYHKFFQYVGAFCPFEKMIHYRWIPTDYALEEDPILRPKQAIEPSILPKKTEYGAERHFLKSQFWNGKENCYDPGYIEVFWSDFEESQLSLLRPTDTGYLKTNNNGIHTPFIGATIEWLLKKHLWDEIVKLTKHSSFAKREKDIILKAVTQPTPSNIFKLLWTFKRFIPGWNSKRSLGKRSPSMLIQDEIRWTTNRLEDLDKVDRERLIRSVSEPSHWNTWPELWPVEWELGSSLAEFGPHLSLIGIHYDQEGKELGLITSPKKHERSWMEIAEKMIEWPVNVNKGGEINQSLSQRTERGFVSSLMKKLEVSIELPSPSKNKWGRYLEVNLPLIWTSNGNMSYHTQSQFVTAGDL
ncbi:MAG: hypothetical protein ACXAE3_01925, partial [Candidatus Kariarchaeaceae archaeon]